MDKFSKLSKDALYDSEKALQYVAQRDLQQESIAEFGVGYIPFDVDTFVRSLETKTKEDLIQLGVLFIHKHNLCSILNDRVVFPIYNIAGNIVSFSGRALPGADPETPKYINTRNSYIFKKSLSLFGFAQAMETIVSQDCCIVVEGNVDVISLWQAGIKNVIAPCGTALTLQQLTILRRVCNRVVLWFDQDAAGQRAKEKSYPIAKELGFEVGVMSAQQWKDPDEVLKNKSVDEILVDINKSFNYVELVK
ncbi:MAG: toprim domain-containing protein [Candidatus Omnitrophica bacterium]|jgi:DNA primase|nr:toprim domain-containing protein [Candidatus Omnitrophota bacterium]